MISNPVKQYVSGSEEKEFTYEGGTKLFHFSPHEQTILAKEIFRSLN